MNNYMKKHKKVIFLDIDGVLNNKESKHIHNHGTAMDKKCVGILRKIVEEFNAVLVISSAWRIAPGIPKIEKGLSWVGWDNPPIIGETPSLSLLKKRRGKEIQCWLKENPTESYIIIDDEPGLLKEHLLKEQSPFLVQPNSPDGLQEKHFRQIQKIWK